MKKDWIKGQWADCESECGQGIEVDCGWVKIVMEKEFPDPTV